VSTLRNDGAAGGFLRERGDFGRGHTTRSAPGSPEVNQHRDLGFARDLVESCGVYFKRRG
jgi:hypothetical protein